MADRLSQEFLYANNKKLKINMNAGNSMKTEKSIHSNAYNYKYLFEICNFFLDMIFYAILVKIYGSGSKQ